MFFGLFGEKKETVEEKKHRIKQGIVNLLHELPMASQQEEVLRTVVAVTLINKRIYKSRLKQQL